ncbi:uncharacterized protein F4812DRAFT_470927, partial [Daldinia caldariorum]|uniref:uncharacterized protein n=1 Tax=Daldinia caldariorum TaxID=326644 RepID=UPI0020080E16
HLRLFLDFFDCVAWSCSLCRVLRICPSLLSAVLIFPIATGSSLKYPSTSNKWSDVHLASRMSASSSSRSSASWMLSTVRCETLRTTTSICRRALSMSRLFSISKYGMETRDDMVGK